MKRLFILPMLVTCALALAGCGDAISTDDAAEDVQADASDIDAEEPTADADEQEPDSDGTEAEPTGSVPNEPLTGEDGWTELHDITLPDPGRMELTVDGQVFATDIRCGRDPVLDDEESGSMFLFSLLERGVTADGRDFQILVNRAIAIDGQIDRQYETGGSSAQVTLVIDGEEASNSSVVLSPKEGDPEGELLPLVHVDPSGGFTMQGTMEVFSGDDAVAGDAVLAGQCQDGWPE